MRLTGLLSPSRYDLFGMLTGVRADLSEWSALSVKVGRACRFERATRSFYDRCRAGKTPGYPRLEPRRRWRSVEIPDPSVSMVSPPATSRNRSERWWRLEVKGMPRLRFVDRNWRLAAALGNGSEDAAVSNNVRVWQLRAGPRQGPQRSPQHMRPRRLPPTGRRRAGGTGGT